MAGQHRWIAPNAGARVEIVTIRTSGDQLQTRPFSETGTKRLFVKEIEDALLAKTVDVAVHSAKDMTVDQPEGLDISATLPRQDSAGRAGVAVEAAGHRPARGARVPRRAGQHRHEQRPPDRAADPGPARRDLQSDPGNVDTRLNKLDAGEFDALILASAGMRRLGRRGSHLRGLALRHLRARTRPGDHRDPDPPRRREHAAGGAAPARSGGRNRAAAERALVEALGGGCQLPLGAIAIHDGGELDMQAVVISLDGARVIRARRRGPFDEPMVLGRQLAADLSSAGAREVLEAVRRAQ